ncbi:hypothetical protein GCM10029964_042750 [Kibdelosporangium lantanae]
MIPQLRSLLAENPLREELWRQLVLGLHREGRAAEALDAYAEVERVLAAELGIRPGPALRRVRDEVTAAVLATDPDTPPDEVPGHESMAARFTGLQQAGDAIHAAVFPVRQLPSTSPTSPAARTCCTGSPTS